MKKAFLVGIISLLGLAPFHCAFAQSGSNLDTKSPEKSAAASASPTDERKDPNPTSEKAAGNVTARSQAAPATATESELSSKEVAADDAALTEIYKIGVGDVLDIRLLNSRANRSTLYSVIEGGLIDFPIAGGPIPVVGLTTKEIQARLTADLKRLAVEEQTQVAVGVRQYGSHTVIITGLVGSPGTRFLRREAVPLYVLMAEVQPRLDAERAAIMRGGAATAVLDLSDSTALSFLVHPGDVINVIARPQEFYYIAGNISHPGQKAFEPGITLIQAILAAGDLARNNVVEISRAGSDGLLVTTRIKVKEIKSGKIQDPKLQPGDRIEVLR